MPHKLHVPKMAIFVAITLALQSIPLPPLGGGVLRFAALPIILSGLILGPKAGFWVGAVSDVLECLLIPRGRMYFPGFTLTQALTGAIPALLLRNSPPSYWRYLLAIAVGQGLTKFILVPVFLLAIAPVPSFWSGYQVLVAEAMLAQALHVPVYAWICLAVMRHLAPLLPPANSAMPTSTNKSPDLAVSSPEPTLPLKQ